MMEFFLVLVTGGLIVAKPLGATFPWWLVAAPIGIPVTAVLAVLTILGVGWCIEQLFKNFSRLAREIWQNGGKF